MISYEKQTSLDKPTVEILKTSYNVQVFKNIIQLPNGSWQFDKDVYSIAEYSIVEQKEKQDLLDTINKLKEDNAKLIIEVEDLTIKNNDLVSQTESLKEKVATNNEVLDTLFTDIIPSLQA